MRTFRLTHPFGGSIEVSPSFMEERYCFNPDGSIIHEEIAHLGWRALFNNRDTKHIIKKLCDDHGSLKVKNQYTAQIKIEEVTNGIRKTR
jgi:hypothetical protein